jgi:hypothetical protein
MTDQRELDRILDAFLANGTDELADRVIDAALDQVDHTRQRHALRMPRRFLAMPMLTRVAAAAGIGVLAVGSAFFLFQHGQPSVGAPAPASGATASPGEPATTPAPVSTPAPTPSVAPTASPQAALTGPMGEGRQIHTSTVLADGRVLVAGGYALGDGPLASASVYDPATNTFSPTGSLADARGEHTATLLKDGRVLVTGGGIAGWVATGAFLASAELYDPKTGTFSRTGSLATPRQGHTATLLKDGRVLITGGADTKYESLASAELYDPKTGTFSATGSMAEPRSWHTATLLSDGRVLVTGGWPAGWSSSSSMVSSEVYDPKTGTFTTSGRMTLGRSFHAATLLGDGRVLVTGGASPVQDDLKSAELYDPKTGTFSATGSMTDGRQYHTSTLLADGRVLVAGGGGDYTNGVFIASAELYDPKTGTFGSTGPLAEARTNHMASMLADGRVLVTGGYGADAPLASSELYDPKTGTFAPAG